MCRSINPPLLIFTHITYKTDREIKKNILSLQPVVTQRYKTLRT